MLALTSFTLQYKNNTVSLFLSSTWTSNWWGCWFSWWHVPVCYRCGAKWPSDASHAGRVQPHRGLRAAARRAHHQSVLLGLTHGREEKPAVPGTQQHCPLHRPLAHQPRLHDLQRWLQGPLLVPPHYHRLRCTQRLCFHSDWEPDRMLDSAASVTPGNSPLSSDSWCLSLLFNLKPCSGIFGTVFCAKRCHYFPYMTSLFDNNSFRMMYWNFVLLNWKSDLWKLLWVVTLLTFHISKLYVVSDSRVGLLSFPLLYFIYVFLL